MLIGRYWRTVRHLRGQQVLSRARLRLASRARAWWPAATTRVYERRVARSRLVWRDDLLGLRDSAARLRVSGPEATAASEVAAAVARGCFRYLNESGELGWPPDWAAPAKSQLWRYHLHYFEELIDLALVPPSPVSRQLIEHWLESNPVHGRGATRDAWHPYVVSLRMVNWMLALSAIDGAAAVPAHIRRRLEEHAVFLERNLETDVDGNHLLKNLKAMTFAGCFWDGPLADSWRQRFGWWFLRALERQVLADGGHYERAPMYHCQVMQDAIEVAALVSTRDRPLAEALGVVIGRMDRFLAEVTHPDGDIALFNDSAFEVVPAPAVLRRAASRLAGEGTAASLPRLDLLLGAALPIARDPNPATAPSDLERQLAAVSSGYVALPRGASDRFLLADVGAVCPDDLPAHAHADMLSFELSVRGQRMLVDSGVGVYAAGAWRDYYRSTRAHNTVMVDGCEQSECWGSFRVGRRASPVSVTFRRGHDLEVLAAEHTGYDHLAGRPRHRRQFAWSEHGFWIVADTLSGRGSHSWTSFCHLHPDSEVIAQTASWLRIARDETVLDLAWYGFGEARGSRGQSGELQGWYAERLGPPIANTVLMLDGSGEVPASFGYALVPRPSREAPAAAISLSPSGELDVMVDDRTHRINLAAAVSVSGPG